MKGNYRGRTSNSPYFRNSLHNRIDIRNPPNRICISYRFLNKEHIHFLHGRTHGCSPCRLPNHSSSTLLGINTIIHLPPYKSHQHPQAPRYSCFRLINNLPNKYHMCRSQCKSRMDKGKRCNGYHSKYTRQNTGKNLQ